MRPMWLLLLLACGPSDDTRLADLSEEEATQLCDRYSYDAHVVECDDGSSFEIGASDDQSCVDRLLDTPVTCQATVADARACYDIVLNEDPCTPVTELPVECEWQIDQSCVPPL